MLTGISPGEIAIVGLVLVLALNRKDLVALVRSADKWKKQLIGYQKQIQTTFEEIVSVGAPPPEPYDYQKKNSLRDPILTWRKELAGEARKQANDAIRQLIIESALFNSSKQMMLYSDFNGEVATKGLIAVLLQNSKKVVLPYIRVFSDESDSGSPMGFGEISNFDTDVEKGFKGFLQPKKERWENFFKSDIGFVLCPIVAFDQSCNALFRSESYWSMHLEELKGRAPIWGVAFAGQMTKTLIPAELSEFKLDAVVTENGIMFPPPTML